MYDRNAFTVILFFFFSLQLCGVSAKPTYSLVSKRSPSRSSLSNSLQLEYSTNAKRMAAGLNPHTPIRPFNPSRIVARDPQASPVSYSGVILTRDVNSNPMGYISKTTSTGRIRMTAGVGDALPVSLSFSSSTAVFGLSIMDGATWPWLGIQGSSLSGTMSTTVNGFVRSNAVTAGSAASVVGHSAGSGSTETHIFKFNPTTNEITAIWVNPNLAVLDAYFYLSNGPGLKFYYLTTNPNLTAAQGVTRVRLYLQT